MKREQFIQYLENPLLLGEANIAELKSVVEAYPFFQTAHLLYAKALSNVNHIDYYTGLKKTSILAGDRKVLYELITKSAPKTNQAIPLPETVQEEKKEVIKVQEEKKEPVVEKIVLPEIKLVSNVSEKQKHKEQTIDFETRPLVEPVKKEETIPIAIGTEETRKETTRIELVVTSRDEKKPEEKKIVQEPVEKKIQQTPIEPKEKNVDDVVLNQVVNAYIETEFFDVRNIDKPLKLKETGTIDPEEGKKILTETLNEPHSFSAWLKLLSAEKKKPATSKKQEGFSKEIAVEKPIKTDESSIKKAIEEQEKIINKIITTEPSISKLKKTTEFFKPVEKAKESIIKDETLVTETLAWILEKQGKYAEAIRAYETLSLKYPEKSVKFASLISEIKIKQKQK